LTYRLTITAIVTSALGLFSCEKHSWEKETKKLYQHGDPSDDQDGDNTKKDH